MILYKSGYKYQLAESCSFKLQNMPRRLPWEKRIPGYVDLSKDGYLLIAKGYAWDGPSGPAIDTKNFMRGSLVHDALYQLIRETLLPASWKEWADEELCRICKEDGMSSLRIWWVRKALKWFGHGAVNSSSRKPVESAP